MMRGAGIWAVACRKPAADQLDDEGHRADMNDPPRGEIDVQSHEVQSVLTRRRILRLPIVRGVVALGESLVIGFKALGISANAQMPEEEEPISGVLWTADDRLRARAVGRALLHRAGHPDEPRQGPARLRVPLLGRRGRAAHRDLPGLPAADLAHARPAARVRVPRRRAQDDLLLRGGPRADAGERAALLAPASALRHELPAARDDRRHLRLLPARPAALVGADRHPDRRRAADRRHLVRADQARRQAPPPALGADPHVAGAEAAAAHHA